VKWSPRRLLYLILWGSTLLAFLSRLHFLPGWFRFAMYASAMISNCPGVMILGKLFSYHFTRTMLGELSAACLTTLLVEPVLRWIERPLRHLPPQEAAPQVTRRALLLGAGASTGLAGLGAYSFAIERKRFEVTSQALYLPNLHPKLDGLRVVVMADLHCGPVNRPGDLRPALQLAAQCKPDLVLLPGDFVHLSGDYFAEAAELLSLLKPGISNGILMSWGNHDYWNEIERAYQTLSPLPLHLLRQQRLILSPGRDFEESGPGLALVGLDDLWEGKPDLAQALRGLPAQQPRLVLCHNPDCAERLSGGRVDLMLSGHTHGGQIRLPGMGTPVLPSRYGQKYASGLVAGPNYPVYVTRGLGVGGIPVRFGVRPEVTFIELRSSQKGWHWQPLERVT
jgi:predicted MPP superfamily phosphohydrolase